MKTHCKDSRYPVKMDMATGIPAFLQLNGHGSCVLINIHPFIHFILSVCFPKLFQCTMLGGDTYVTIIIIHLYIHLFSGVVHPPLQHPCFLLWLYLLRTVTSGSSDRFI